MNDIIQFKITLVWSKPPIWRRILIDRKTTIPKLHQILQVAFGWHDCHLHQFETKYFRIGISDDHSKYINEDTYKPLDKKLTVGDLVDDVKDKIKYEYDFGDSWMHEMVVEKFLPKDTKLTYPTCIKGKMNTPPEDCGGIYGYYDMVEAIQDKNHPEHEEMTDWMGDDFDPEYFDADEINAILKRIK